MKPVPVEQPLSSEVMNGDTKKKQPKNRNINAKRSPRGKSKFKIKAI